MLSGIFVGVRNTRFLSIGMFSIARLIPIPAKDEGIGDMELSIRNAASIDCRYHEVDDVFLCISGFNLPNRGKDLRGAFI